jgi:hypothetical protein
MTCINCGKINDSESNFCKYCGSRLKTNITGNQVDQPDPNFSIFNTYDQPGKKTNADLGYLIISIIIITNIFMWLVWTFLGISRQVEYRTGIRVLQVLGTLFLFSEFVVMFAFTKRTSYRIVIAIIGAFVLISQIITLIKIMGVLDS